MVNSMPSRVQRRKEKNRAILVLVVLLVVSLVSFSIGVMVGKSSSPAPSRLQAAAVPESSSSSGELRQAEQKARQPAPPRPAPQASPAPDALPEAASALPGEKPVASAASPRQEPAPEPSPELSFYKALPEAAPLPLGSGLNPGLAQQGAAAGGTKSPPAATSALPAGQGGAVLPKASAEGRYVVQVASFKAQEDAAALQQRLQKAGYAAFIETATVGEKGTWHRVRIGPFAEALEAQEVVSRIKEQEKLSAFMTQR